MLHKVAFYILCAVMILSLGSLLYAVVIIVRNPKSHAAWVSFFLSLVVAVSILILFRVVLHWWL